MLTNELKVEVFKRFSNSYAELLEKLIYKDKRMVKKLFSDETIYSAYEAVVVEYFNALVEFYAKYPDGSYLDELDYVKSSSRVRRALKVYEEMTGDRTLMRYLQVYSYCVQEPSGLIYDKNYRIVQDSVDDYFAQTHDNSIAMYEKFEKDINEGNYWWLRNSATTLRRQLFENIIVINEKRFTFLCDTYFQRKVDINKEFVDAVNGGEKLVPELDAVMAKRYKAKPYYCWWETKKDGKRVLHMEEEPPADGVYAYVAYHDRKETRAVNKDNYYL